MTSFSDMEAMYRFDAEERDVLLVALSFPHDENDRWEIVGIRNIDGALRVRHVERGTKSIVSVGSYGAIALTRGAAEFIARVREMWDL